jgi:HEAT repeat protein
VALAALVRLGAATPDDIGAGLADPDPSVRRRALTLVAAAPVGRVAPDLLPLLPDPDDRVTEVAAFAAGELAPPAPAIVAALAAIATDHPDALCRESAVAALGSLGEPAGLSAVLVACTDIAAVRRRAVLALAAFDGEDVEAAIVGLTSDRDLQVRQAAEDLLAISRGQEL